MNIIFGRENIGTLAERYTVLELDTIKLPDDREITAFCVVENIPINHLPQLESMRNLHENLLLNYRKRDWNYCTQALEYLKGFWNHELDTYYDNLQSRIDKEIELGDNEGWDWKINKTF